MILIVGDLEGSGVVEAGTERDGSGVRVIEGVWEAAGHSPQL